ncbi:MAG: DUF447 family protein [Pirellulaceae bacterium]|nr:DUF447 family protein [Pirellulaceae bacterium]MDP7019972.1 DUF447 family protein [Pirellulaceae bacterium]
MILEGIVTTTAEDGAVNVSPMGPRVEPEMLRFTLRPFQTSQTFQNLRRSGRGVLHVTDDVEMIALAAVGQLPNPKLTRLASGGMMLADACRWYDFRVESLDDTCQRTIIECQVTETGRNRDFFGLNRAKHAVLEAAILATRVHLIPAADVRQQMQRLKPLIEKTSGPAEERAFDFLSRYIEQQLEQSA